MAEAARLFHGSFSYRDVQETNDPLLPQVRCPTPGWPLRG